MYQKMKLMRQKDFTFQAKLIRYITQIGNKDVYDWRNNSKNLIRG
jgi:hypothetical protein